MPTIVNNAFKSEYGFDSPSFTVDELGNITARSITLEVAEADDDAFVTDFDVTEVGGNFRIDAGAVDNPAITLFRNGTKTFDLNLSTLSMNIYSSIGGSPVLYGSGLRHSDGTTQADAQGKTTGTLYVSIPSNAPDTLYYGNADSSVYGTITVENPTGLFGSAALTSTTAATSTTTGALTVAGGVGIAEDLYVGGQLNVSGIGIAKLDSTTNLDINAANKIILQIADTKLGELNSTGLAVTINNSTIDNTVIGSITPAVAAFSAATIVNAPTVGSSITNKDYVDSQALSLAIAFGL
tara:strand:+ start:12121 stop:13008 length:888 start_codon:yes stop_codon:yes gene_type:complete